MSNTMCGVATASSAKASAIQTPIKNGAVAEYLRRIKTIAHNNTISINETVKWISTTTESFNLPNMCDKLAQISVDHEKEVERVLHDLDRYAEKSYASHTALLADYIRRLSVSKKDAFEKIMNEVTYSLTTTDLCRITQRGMCGLRIGDIKILHDNISREAGREHANNKRGDGDTGFMTVIKRSESDLDEQTKDMNKDHLLTISEIGWNFRRLADYCDELAPFVKAKEKPSSESCCNAPSPSHVDTQTCSQPCKRHHGGPNEEFAMAMDTLKKLLSIVSKWTIKDASNDPNSADYGALQYNVYAKMFQDLSNLAECDCVDNDKRLVYLIEQISRISGYLTLCRHSMIKRQSDKEQADK